jgi:predicted Fe-S protein YdhL (DUF1289 family)
MQMSLPFLEDPPTNPPIWEQLDDQLRAEVLEKLAQLIARTAGAETGREESSHD